MKTAISLAWAFSCCWFGLASASGTSEHAVTNHELVIEGRTTAYRATAGYIDLKVGSGEARAEDEGLKATARMFYVAYTIGAAGEQRPVTFIFNGGPGSSAIWLHLGGLGPRRASLSPEGEALSPPYGLVDNEASWLSRTDLVFVDPVSTGYSRVIDGGDAQRFYGYHADVRSTGEFIQRYLTRERRWLSPKFVLGESYGAARAAGLAEHLQDRYGIYLNGVILVSPALNLAMTSFTPQNDEPYINILPTYAAAAWRHGKLTTELQSRSLEGVVAEARAYAWRDYAFALRQGSALPSADKREVARQLGRLTSLPAEFFEQHQLRVPSTVFLARLLEEQGRIAGRFDARYVGLPYTPGAHSWDYDPTNESVFGPVSAAFNHYIRAELGFESERIYQRYGATRDLDWNFGDGFDGFLNAAEDLRKAMLRNPYLQVWVACGYYDFATPLFAAESTIRALLLPEPVRRNVQFTYYEAGHSFYVHAASRGKLRGDLIDFLERSLNQPAVPAVAANHTRRSVPPDSSR